MSIHKTINANNSVVITNNTLEDKNLFPAGFCYKVGNIIYTVKADVTKEENSPMREVLLSDGRTEIMLIETIKRDLKEHDCVILPIDDKFAKRQKSDE
jgi:hypothetical protein